MNIAIESFLKSNPTELNDRYIFLVPGERWFNAVMIAGYNAVPFDSKFTVDDFIEIMDDRVLKPEYNVRDKIYVPCLSRKDNERIEEYLNCNQFEIRENGWKIFGKEYLKNDEYQADLKKILTEYIEHQEGPKAIQPATTNGFSLNLEYRKLKNGTEVIVQSIKNIATAIEEDPELKGHILYNVMAHTPCIMGTLPWKADPSYREWTNSDDANLRLYLEDKYNFTSKDKILDALNVVTERNKINPVTSALETAYKAWDGETGHIRNLAVDYLGCEDTDYHYESVKLFMLGAIRRAYQPGTKFDYMIVLVGPQGCGKSTFLKCLALKPEWYNENLNTIEGDSAIEKIRGKWIVEMAELLATKRSKEVEGIKAFLTTSADDYRPKYGIRTERRLRACVFAGTTNDEGFLTDRTGNRRFLPITTRKDKRRKDLFGNPESVKNDFIQAWAEAMDLYLKNPEMDLVLPKSVIKEAEEVQDEYMAEDGRVGVIQEFLDKHMGIEKVCVMQLYQDALGHIGELPKRSESNEIHAIMRNNIKGWELARTGGNKLRFDKYGPQKAYTRIINEGFVPTTEVV